MSEDFIQLYSGKPFHFLNPSEDEIDIEDIAHTLSLLCRFGGHCREFYSVADHSILCAKKASPENKLEALLHDATEAYLVDMPRPIKHTLQGYLDIEEVVDRVVRKKFNLPAEMTKEVKFIDNAMLATERRDLMKSSEKPWAFLPDPYDEVVKPMTSEEARTEFLNMYHQLNSGFL